jgi:hypothetical protein
MESDDKADIIAELSDDQAKAVLDAIEPRNPRRSNNCFNTPMTQPAYHAVGTGLLPKTATINDAFQAGCGRQGRHGKYP